MAKVTYELPNGGAITVDDTITLLGPNPNLAGCGARNSPRDLKNQPIQFWKADEAHRRTPHMPSGYGVTQAELDEYIYHCGGIQR
jgi:hypothetical protein